MSGLDHKKLAVIHIVKRELGLAEKEYRDLLEQAAGVRSARDLDEDGFRRLMRAFARSRHFRAHADGLTIRQQLYIKHLVADLGWDQGHLANFLNKYYKKGTLAALSRKEASKVIVGLQSILAARRQP
jgi:hypothetical protein